MRKISILILLFFMVGCSQDEAVEPSPISQLSTTAVSTLQLTPTILTNEELTVTIISTNSPTLTPIPSPLLTTTVEPTATIEPVEISSQGNTPLYIETYGLGYARYDYDSNEYSDYSDYLGALSVLDYTFTRDPDDLVTGPADARLLVFANFADQMAYWITDGTAQLWLSDLEVTNQQLIFTDESQVYSKDYNDDAKFRLQWTPDDLHLIWSTHDDLPTYIYHVQSGEIELWPWTCDRVASSPKTNKLATWCISNEQDSQFAVIEWGGEIWYSDTPPVELVRQDDKSAYAPPIWAWSSDGEQFSYFDPNDSGGSLFITDAQGNEIISFPAAAWWFTDVIAESRLQLPSTLLQWSEDGSQILVFTHELTTDACSPFQSYWTEEFDVFYDVPCWHVVDTETGDVLWSWAELTNINEDLDSYTWFARNAAIPSVGKRLAFNISVSSRVELGIVDFENALYEQSSRGGSVIRWGNNN